MITMTKIAVEKFNELRRNAKNPENKMLRVSLLEIGWDGPKFRLTLDELKGEKNVNDKVIETSSVKVVYKSQIGNYLERVVIEYSEDWSNYGFIIGGSDVSYCW